MSAKLPGLQPVRTGDPAQDRFLEAVRERLEVREGVRGDPLEAVVLQRDLVELGIKKQSRVALPDGKPGFVTQLADGSFSAISADELVSRLESTDWYRSLASAPGGVTDNTRQSILSAITEEISKRGAEDRRLDSVMAGIREELLRKIGDLAARVSGASAAPPTPNNYDTFTVTLLADNTRVFTFAYTTTPVPVDLAGAVIRFKKGATGTELWGAMSPLHEGVLTNSPTETRAGDPDVYRFAIKARTRTGAESTDATVRYVDITLPALADPADVSVSSDSILFLEDATGSLTNPTITLTASLAGTLAGGTVTWSHSTGYGGSTPSGTNTWAVSGASQTAEQVTYTASITSGSTTYTDSVVLYKVRQGAEQIVVALTNPVISVPATSAGVVTTFTAQTTELQVYYGGSLASDSLLTYTVASDPSGTGLTVASTGIYTLSFPGSPSGWWTSSSPSANVVLRAALVSDPAAYREITLVITKNIAGSAADGIQLDATTLAFSLDTAGTAYPAAQSSILTLTRTPTSLSGTATWSATAFDSSGTQIGSTGGVALTGTGDTRTLTTSNFMAPGGSFNNNIQYVNVTATLGTLSKSVRVIRITDGVEPILSFLTNSSVTLPASSAGVVSSWAGATGDFQVWQGGVEVTTGITYAIQANPSTLTATINSSTGVYSVTAAGSWADASSTTSITFRATHTATGATRDAVFTLTKSLTGATGPAGSSIQMRLTAPSYVFSAASDGTVSDYSGFVDEITIYDGTTNVTNLYSIARSDSLCVSTLNSVAGPITGASVVYLRITSMSADASLVTITATRSGYATLTATVYLSKAKAGTDAVTYEIVPSVDSVAKNNIGVMSPATVTYSFYSKTGSAARVAYSGRVIIETSTDYGTGWSVSYTSGSNEASKVFTVPSGITHMRARLHLAGGTTTQVAQITVPVIPDGIRSPMTLNSNSSATAVYGTVTGSAVNWSDAKGNEVVWRKLGYTSAPSATPADYLVRTDLVTLFDTSPPTAGIKPATRYWTGSAWADPGTVIDGNLLVKGTVTMDSLQSGSTISTSGVSFGLGVSWGPGSSPSGGYFHSTVSTSFALVADNVAGGYAIASATTATNDSGAAFAGGGGWTGHTTTGGVTSGGTYTTYGFIATGTAGGIFRYGSTAEARLGEITSGSVSAGRFSQGSYLARLGTSAEAVRAAYSTTQVVSLGTSTHAIDITAGDFKYGAITIAAPPNSYSYLDGTGTWRDLSLDGSTVVTSNFTGLRPAGSGANNIWIKFYVGATAMYIPAWYG